MNDCAVSKGCIYIHAAVIALGSFNIEVPNINRVFRDLSDDTVSVIFLNSFKGNVFAGKESANGFILFFQQQFGVLR